MLINTLALTPPSAGIMKYLSGSANKQNLSVVSASAGAVPVRVQPTGICCRGVDPDVIALHPEGAETLRHGPTAARLGQPRGQQRERGDS